jgi:hypothetical protein
MTCHCVAEYQSRLQAWFGSPEYKQKERETEVFRQSIQQLVPQLNTSLANWWNVYDAFNVWEKYQVGDEMPALSSEQSQQVGMHFTKNTLEHNLLNSELRPAAASDPLLHCYAMYIWWLHESQGMVLGYHHAQRAVLCPPAWCELCYVKRSRPATSSPDNVQRSTVCWQLKSCCKDGWSASGCFINLGGTKHAR